MLYVRVGLHERLDLGRRVDAEDEQGAVDGRERARERDAALRVEPADEREVGLAVRRAALSMSGTYS